VNTLLTRAPNDAILVAGFVMPFTNGQSSPGQMSLSHSSVTSLR